MAKTVINVCDATTDFSVVTGTGTVSSETTIKKEGTGSVKSTSTASAGGEFFLEYNPTASIDLSTSKYLIMYVRRSTAGNVIIKILDGSSNYYSWTKTVLADEWTCCLCDLENPDASSGTPTLSTIDKIDIGVTGVTALSDQGSWYIDYIYAVDEQLNTREIISADRLNPKVIYRGSTAPSVPFDGQIWMDTATGMVKYYDLANTTWRKFNYVTIAIDDTQKTSTSGTTEYEVKTFRLVKNTDMPYKSLHIIATLWVSAGTGTFYVYANSEGTSRDSATSTEISESTSSIISCDVDVTDLSTGIHTFKIKIKRSSSGGTVYTKYLHVIAVGT